jgi:hypothetical protein
MQGNQIELRSVEAALLAAMRCSMPELEQLPSGEFVATITRHNGHIVQALGRSRRAAVDNAMRTLR